MINIHTTLNNFSVFEELFSCFSGFDIKITEKGVIHENITLCPLCKDSVSFNGYNNCTDKRAKQFGLDFKKGKLICTNPLCTFSYNVKKVVLDVWFSKFDEYIEKIILSLKAKKLSPPKIAVHIRETLQYNISDDYISDKIKKLIDNMKLPAPQEIPSGVIVHDEQFVTIKGIEMMRISTIDANNPNVYYDKLHDDRTEETIIQICKKLKEESREFRAVIMDGHTASHTAYKQIFSNILIQFCLFHYAKNVREAYKDEVGYGKGNAFIPLEHLIAFFSIMNIFFNHEREIFTLRNFQRELNEHIERINKAKYTVLEKQKYIEDYKKKYDQKARKHLYEVRKTRRRKKGIPLALRTEEQAKQLLQKAKLENVFPKKVQKQITRLEKNWISFTHCLRDNTISPTSNKVEQFYSLTLSWSEKNNLQSEQQFYDEQKLALYSRYKISFLKENVFFDLLKKTFVLLGTFGKIT